MNKMFIVLCLINLTMGGRCADDHITDFSLCKFKYCDPDSIPCRLVDVAVGSYDSGTSNLSRFKALTQSECIRNFASSISDAATGGIGGGKCGGTIVHEVQELRKALKDAADKATERAIEERLKRETEGMQKISISCRNSKTDIIYDSQNSKCTDLVAAKIVATGKDVPIPEGCLDRYNRLKSHSPHERDSASSSIQTRDGTTTMTIVVFTTNDRGF
jgi:hypothetical protein